MTEATPAFLSAEARTALLTLHERAIAARSQGTAAHLAARLERDAVFAVAVLEGEGHPLVLPGHDDFSLTVSDLADQVRASVDLSERGQAARALLLCIGQCYPALRNVSPASLEIAQSSLVIGHALARLGLAEQGYTPEMLELATTAVPQRAAAARGRRTAKDRADTWRQPLSVYADDWLARKKPAAKVHGMIGRIVADFRGAHHSVALPTTDGPNRLVSERLKTFLMSRSGS